METSVIKRSVIVVSFCALSLVSALSAPVSHAAATGGCPPLTLSSRSLPFAVDGREYRESIQFFGGVAPVSVMLTSGVLPPGIRLAATGEVAGMPTSPGQYEFTVTAVDRCRPMEQSARAVLSLYVNRKGESQPGPDLSVVRKPPLKVSTQASPGRVQTTAGVNAGATIRYTLTAEPPDTATMESPGASFVVNGQVAESIAVPLTAVLVNGEGEVQETVRLTKRALDFAAREKANKIVYSRAFIGRKTTTIAVVEFIIGQ